jgi:excisionase family DNA binding protein
VSDSTASPTVGGVYTMRETARLKGVSYHTVSRTVRRGKLRVQRIGRMAMIAAEDLGAWQPMVERRTSRHRNRVPDPSATPALMDPVMGEWAEMVRRVSALEETVAALTSEVAKLCAALAHDAR